MDAYKVMFYGDFWTFGTNNPKMSMNFSKLLRFLIANEWKI